MRETAESADENWPRKLLALFILGFSTTLVGLVLVTVAATTSQGGSTSSGGIIFIGPIPIVFGAGPGAQWLILIAIALAVLSVIMFLILRRRPAVTLL
jgi:uncharacterized membrane protein